MRIIFEDGEAELKRHKEVLDAIKNVKGTIMAKMEQFQEGFDKMAAETTRIGEYIKTITDQLNRTDLTETQEESLLAALNAAADRLKEIGVTVETPIPEGELPLVA